jgi:hypothetical protein
MNHSATTTKLSLLVLTTFILSGCTNSYFRVKPVLFHPLSNDTTSSQDQSNYKEGQDLQAKPTNKRPINLDEEKYKEMFEAALAGDRPQRNQLQNKIIELSDDVCEQHKGDVVGNASSVNLYTGLGATFFSGISAIVTGAAAANYAATSTLFNATRAGVNADVYQGLFATAIIKAINESREKKKNEIQAKQLKSTQEYSIDSAIIDAQDYHFRCSFYNGLVVLTEDAKKRATPSREETLGKIKLLREERTENIKQKNLVGEDAITSDVTNQKIQQGIDALYDKLNFTE